MIFEFEESTSQNARMKVVGVGGGGGNAVNRMIDEHLEGVEFISVNTDAQALLNSKSDVKIQIGKKLTRGLGAGARPEIGKQAIEENQRRSRPRAARTPTSSSSPAAWAAAPAPAPRPSSASWRAKPARSTVGIVTKPFLFEGRKRMRQAEQGIAEMRKHVDTMIVVPNERLLAVVGKGIPFQDALKKADEVLLHATQGISSLISVTGLVNVDFADVRTVMQDGGSALMGTGIGRGENRAMEAAQQAIASPLLDNVSDLRRDGRAREHHRRRRPHARRSPPDQRDHPRRRRRRRRDHLRRRARAGDAGRDSRHRHRDRLRPRAPAGWSGSAAQRHPESVADHARLTGHSSPSATGEWSLPSGSSGAPEKDHSDEQSGSDTREGSIVS